mmetsp:Transcript_9621/g.32817  ORF Transcript_9621/g.32817 Transcript_9621/m.32817 type:complete len:214 (+) Transcript_9621:275-916(+)
MRRSSIRPSPDSAMAWEMSLAASASPSARITAAFFSCSACITTNVCLSASCCATCLFSMALANSLPKVRCVMDTSSRMRPKFLARAVMVSRICALMVARLDRSSSALYSATVALRISLPTEGSTRSSKSVPSSLYTRGSCSSAGRESTRRLRLTIWRSFVPVLEWMILGRARTSMMMASWRKGMSRCVPSPRTFSSTPWKRSKITARSPPSTS